MAESPVPWRPSPLWKTFCPPGHAASGRERTSAPAAPPAATCSETITERMIAYAPGP